MPVWVEDRRVYVNTQGTQTVKVCSSRNIQGEYEKYYRIHPPLIMSQRQMEDEVARFKILKLRFFDVCGLKGGASSFLRIWAK